jgi:hypothetical protein
VSLTHAIRILFHHGAHPDILGNVSAPSISGTAAQAQVLTIDSLGTWTGTPTGYAYRWFADGVAIGGATSSTFTLTATQIGAVITAGVVASAPGSTSSAEAISNSLGPVVAASVAVPVNTTLPLITGPAKQGYTVSTSDGIWTNSPDTFAYQWKRNGSNISAATASTYVLVSADIGASITVAITATNASGASSPAVSLSIGPVTAAVAPTNDTAPSLSGSAYVGQVLTCNDGAWTADPVATFSRQWKSDAVVISGEINPTYTVLPADFGKTITCSVTATNAGGSSSPITTAGIGPIGTIAPLLDTTFPAPVISLAVPATTYPPQYNISVPAVFQAGAHTIEYANDDDIAFGSPLIDDVVSINDAEATAGVNSGVKVDSNLALVVTPNLTNSRARFRWTVSSVPYCSAWSNIQGHGGVSTPTITSSTSFSAAERSPVLITVTASTTCTFAISGADGSLIEKVGSEPATSIQLRLTGNAIPDYDPPGKQSYSFTVQPTDTIGNVGTATAHTLTITDIDEIANTTGTFTAVTGATISTVYTSNTVTVAGLASAVSEPVTITGGTYSKNGGAYSSAANTVVNGDTLTARVTSSGTNGVGVTASLVIGDVASNQVTRSYTVTAVALTPVDVVVSLGDSNDPPIRNRFVELPPNYYPQADAHSFIADLRLSGTIKALTQPTSAALTFTNASATIAWAGGVAPPNGTPVGLSTTATLPTGFSPTTATTLLYFVVNSSGGDSGLASTVGGAAITATSAGSGVHTANYWTDVGLHQQSNSHAVDLSYSPTPYPVGGDGEWVKELRVDHPTQDVYFVGFGEGSSRFSDAGAAGRLSNWDASLTDGAYNAAKVSWASVVSLLAAQGNSPNVVACIISGPANGVTDTTESNAFQVKQAALIAALRADIVGNTCPILIEQLGNATNQDAFASNATNVATIRAAEQTNVDAEISAGRPAAVINADAFGAVEAATFRLHWGAGSHARKRRVAYWETYNIWWPGKYSETNKALHAWVFGDPRNLPVPPLGTGALSTVPDLVSQLSGAFINPTQATGANQPILSTSTLASGLVVGQAAFDGGNDILVGTGAAFSINGDFCLWGVIKGAATASKCIFGLGGAGANPFFQLHSKSDGSGKLCVTCRDDANNLGATLDSTMVAFDNNWHFFMLWRSGNNWTFRVDGTEVVASTTYNPGTTTLTKTSFGAANTSGGTGGNYIVGSARAFYVPTTGAVDSTYRNHAQTFSQRELGAP